MTVIRITKIFSFEMAHVLWNYDGKCNNIHGHSYKLYVTVIGKIQEETKGKSGMVLDFAELKKIITKEIIDKFDHALVYGNDYDEKNKTIVENYKGKKIEIPFPATTENLIVLFAKMIVPVLPTNVSLHSLKLQETEESYAEWYASDNKDF